MEFGQIIKKAWKLTWRYRFLWVLGIFAGITGAGGGGGSYNFNGGRSFGSGSSGGSGSPFSAAGLSQVGSTIERWIPVIIAVGIVWVVLALLVWALSLAARGGLVWGVNEIEEGRVITLGSAWNRGFSHIWSVLGLGLLLGLPMLLVVALLAAAIGVPVALAVARGGPAAGAVILPVCGTLVIGIPLVLVMGFILGIMYLIGLRRIVLDGIGVVQSAKDAWKTFRARFKDTALMWLINWGLNIAAGLAVGIPVIIVSIVLIVPAVFAAVAKSWGVAAVLGTVWLLFVIVVSVLYAGIWGTFTSALWTILYRRMTGREIVVPTRPVAPVPAAWPPAALACPAPGYPAPGQPAPGRSAPGQPAPGQPAPGGTAPPAPPAGYVAPPMAGWAPAPGNTAGWSPDESAAAPPRGTANDPYSPPLGASGPDPYRDSDETRQPLDPHTPWNPSAPPTQKPPNE